MPACLSVVTALVPGIEIASAVFPNNPHQSDMNPLSIKDVADQWGGNFKQLNIYGRY